jgi:hypothetical protein
MFSASQIDGFVKRLASWKLLLAVLFLLMLFRLACTLEGYPSTWVDEVFYTEPAVNFVNGGNFAAPGVAEQCETKGIMGLDKHYYVNVPIGAYVRIGLYELFGSGQVGRRLTDWTFQIAAVLALFFVLLQRATPQASLLAGIILLTNRVFETDFGRSDTLSLAFGLLALGLVVKPDAAGVGGRMSSGRAFLVGSCVGLSGFTHQFGGVFWAVIVIAAQFAMQVTPFEPVKLARWLAFFVLGCISVGLVWLPQIALAPHVWQQQFFHMVTWKYSLVKNFGLSARGLISTIAAKNPAVIALVMVSPLAVRWQNRPQDRLRAALVICDFLLAVWRCHSFETTIYPYSIHFTAVLCILFALAFDDLARWSEQGFPSGLGKMIRPALIAAVVIPALLMVGLPAMEAFVLPYRATHKAINELLQNNISRTERVLVDPVYYYDVPWSNKCLFVWADKLDLSGFDAVVAIFPTREAAPVSDGNDYSQWMRCFTREQAAIFDHDFVLVTNVPAIWYRPKFYPTAYMPHIYGCYLYRNKHSHTNLTGSAVFPSKP